MKQIVHRCLDCGRAGLSIRYNGVHQCRWCASQAIWPVSSWRTQPVSQKVGEPRQWQISTHGGLHYGKNF